MNTLKIILPIFLFTVPAHAMLAPLARTTTRIQAYPALTALVRCTSSASCSEKLQESTTNQDSNIHKEPSIKELRRKILLLKIGIEQKELRESRFLIGMGSFTTLLSLANDHPIGAILAASVTGLSVSWASNEKKAIQHLQNQLTDLEKSNSNK